MNQKRTEDLWDLSHAYRWLFPCK